MAENEDWWSLCYNTDTKAFFVEHGWHHVRINGLKANSGTDTYEAETWTEQGADAIPGAKAQLLKQAAEE
jgi:hypothetical protein